MDKTKLKSKRKQKVINKNKKTNLKNTKAVAKKLSKPKAVRGKKQKAIKEISVAPYIPTQQDVSPQEKINLMMKEQDIKTQQEAIKQKEEILKTQYDTSKEDEKRQLYALYNNILQENRDRERNMMDLFRQQSKNQGGLFIQKPNIIYLPDRPRDNTLEQIEYLQPETIEQQVVDSNFNPLPMNQILEPQITENLGIRQLPTVERSSLEKKPEPEPADEQTKSLSKATVGQSPLEEPIANIKIKKPKKKLIVEDENDLYEFVDEKEGQKIVEDIPTKIKVTPYDLVRIRQILNSGVPQMYEGEYIRKREDEVLNTDTRNWVSLNNKKYKKALREQGNNPINFIKDVSEGYYFLIRNK
jgi:hypothetical protein